MAQLVWLAVVAVPYLPGLVCISQGLIFTKNILKSHDAAATSGKSHHLIKLPLLRYRDWAKVPSSKSLSFPREEVAISAPGTLGGIQHWSESGDDNQFKETKNQGVFCSPGDTNI